jgi:hypothetical protein
MTADIEKDGFDPRSSAEGQRNAPFVRMGKVWIEQPETYFKGLWEESNELNTPGPFYGAETDTCLDGPEHAPRSLLCDADGHGFVWRQPRTDEETIALMTGASSDPFAGFGWDGDAHWTAGLVREWWARRDERAPLVGALIAKWTTPKLSIAGAAYADYIKSELPGYLRRYMYFLEKGRYPARGDLLPPL